MIEHFDGMLLATLAAILLGLILATVGAYVLSRPDKRLRQIEDELGITYDPKHGYRPRERNGHEHK